MTSIPSKKWFMINIRAPESKVGKEDLLLDIYTNAIFAFRDRVENWHFLWEGAPYEHTLLLRFYGDPATIDELEATITGLLHTKRIENRIEKYDGEAMYYGNLGWQYLVRVLHLGSEFAIDILNNERGGKRSEGMKLTLLGYLERWVHLFMNQLFTRVNEYSTLFQLSIHRYAVNTIGEERYRKIAKDLDKEVRGLISHYFNETVDPILNRLEQAER